jgi:hypothetical protein
MKNEMMNLWFARDIPLNYSPDIMGSEIKDLAKGSGKGWKKRKISKFMSTSHYQFLVKV